MCLANMVKENTPTQNEAYATGVHSRLLVRLNDRSPQVRATVCYALGCLVGSPAKQGSQGQSSSAQDFAALQQQQQQQQGINLPLHGQVFLQQRLSGAHNLVLPGTMASAPSSVTSQLQTTFNPTAAVPNLHWRPQPMDPVRGGVPGAQIHLQQQGMPVSAGPQFLNQPIPLRPAAAAPQAIPAQYILHAEGQPNITVVAPPGFLVGSAPLAGSSGRPVQLHAQQLQPEPAVRLMKPSVFEDGRRMELDLSVMDALTKATHDISVLVRYEAVVSLACGVSKYLDAFVVIAEEAATPMSSDTDARTSGFRLPRKLDRKILSRFAELWKAIRAVQHSDPFPPVGRAANQIVIFVHEHVLRYRMEMDLPSDRDESQTQKLARFLTGIEEEFDGFYSTIDGPRTPPSQTAKARPKSTGKAKHRSELRRVVSEITEGAKSMEHHALLSLSGHAPAVAVIDMLMNYTMPKSEFYEWQKSTFDTSFKNIDSDTDMPLDLLSPDGAAKAYQEIRKSKVAKKGQEIASRYTILAPKPPKPQKQSIQMLLEEEDDEALEAAEEEASRRRKELHMKELSVLRNDGEKMTSMIRFHGLEDVLASCGSSGNVALWDTNSGKRLTSFANGNSEDCRITTSCWMNEDTSSLLAIGCEDGTVRIWGSLLERNGEPSETPPNLVSSFHALQVQPNKRGSGLICEWQPYSGVMLAAGGSKVMNCWDLEAERNISQIETNTEADVTTLTTAWDYEKLGMGDPPGGQGIGRDVVVAGHSDGSIKIFDLRAHGSVNDRLGASSHSRRSRLRPTGYTEHKSWVVTTAFTSYSNRYELISGTVAGEIKAWDLRMSASVRTLEVQRSTMTALTVHCKIPVAATGSNAQFIKILTLDGDTMQVIRYHEKTSGRIGPVSCLAFHRFKPILAAGSTENVIGLYQAKSFTM